MRLLLASIALLAGATAHADYDDPYAHPSSLAIWLQPLGTAFLIATGDGLYLPVGANIRASENFDIQMELTVLAAQRPHPDAQATRIRSGGFTFTVGPAFRGRTFFFAPKILFAVQKDAVVGPAEQGIAPIENTAVVGHLGADVGMDLRAGGMIIGFATGASVGLCRGCASPVFSPFGGIDGGPIANSSRTFMPSFGLNVNLLRVGAAF